VTPDKRLGQHFLTDRTILQRIVDALDPAPDDVVVEIGAGKGSLTEVLSPRVGHVIAIERDRRLISELRMRNAECGIDRLSIVQGDALRVDWHALAIPHFKVVGNIPYAITSPLIDKALTPPLPACIVFLLQAEVADRIAAPPGSKAYGALSVGVQAVCRVEKLFAVRAGAFTPPPKVHSALVRLTPLAQPVVAPEEIAAFRAFVTACFTRRRKQLRNVVMAATGRSAAVVAAGLAALGLDPMVRPEMLAPQVFVRLLRWSARL
jgi:16S rRNA (adenine1518-N6/adenine1519-N6)-dimethyltransferase